MFIQNAGALASQLDMHHNIVRTPVFFMLSSMQRHDIHIHPFAVPFAQEERHIFPILAKKMPQFKAGARESGEHLKSHKAIHQGECVQRRRKSQTSYRKRIFFYQDLTGTTLFLKNTLKHPTPTHRMSFVHVSIHSVMSSSDISMRRSRISRARH
jgi:hypothetical protein